MAAIAGLAVVLISRHADMAPVGVGLIMLVAEDAFESGEVIGIEMAIGAGAPSPLMPPREYGEVLGVVIPGGRLPGIGVMTQLALCGEAHSLMIGV